MEAKSIRWISIFLLVLGAAAVSAGLAEAACAGVAEAAFAGVTDAADDWG